MIHAAGKKPDGSAFLALTLEPGVFRNESPIAIVMCAVCGCVLGTLPSSAVAEVKAA
jgi:hypothetical protein